MSDEPLPQSAAPDEDTAALYEAAAEPLAPPASANGNAGSRQAQEATHFEANRAANLEANSATGDHAPVDMNARPHAAPVGPVRDLPARDASTRGLEDSPEMLRWRADMLLDEMMVGAVDASAGDQGGFFRPTPPTARAEWIQEVAPPAVVVEQLPVEQPPVGQPPVEQPAAPSNGYFANGAPRRAPRPLPAKGMNGAPLNGHGAGHLHNEPQHSEPQRSEPQRNGTAPASSTTTQSAATSNGIVGASHAAQAASADENAPVPTNGFVLSNGIRGGTGEIPPTQPADASRDAAAAPEPSSDEAPIPPAPFRPPPSVVARDSAAQRAAVGVVCGARRRSAWHRHAGGNAGECASICFDRPLQP